MSESTRTCRRCGVDISDLRRDAVWCRKCPKRELLQLESRQCEICGEIFQPRRRDAVCCSRSCNARRLNRIYDAQKRGPAVARRCPGCATSFLPFRSDQKWCTAACGNRARARARYRYKQRPPIPCSYCGTVFSPPRTASVYCSRACSRKVTYARYRDKRVAAAVAWGRANREARVAISNQYKAQRKQMEQPSADNVGVSSRDWKRMLRRYGHCCSYCGAKAPLHMEHVIPLSRGGRHAIGNVLPACERCNLSKQANLVAEWKLRKKQLARLALTG